MTVTVSFDLRNDEDRAEIYMMLELYDSGVEQQCGTGCNHTGVVAGLTPLEVGRTIVAGKPAGFAATLPGDDGSEQIDDDRPIDPATVGFGQAGNAPAAVVAAPAILPSTLPATPAVTPNQPTSIVPIVPVPAPPIVVADTAIHSASTAIATPAEVPAPPTIVTPAQMPAKDAAGLPWDVRIHSSSKALNADGTWRIKRGLNPVIKNQVEAELRAPVAPAMPGNVPVPPAAVVAGPVTAPVVVPPAPPVTAAVTAPPPPVDSKPASFANALIAMSAAKWSKQHMDERVAFYGHTVGTLAQADAAVWAALINEAAQS
jgi:hypothetical protein